MNIISRTKIWLNISAVLVVTSIIALAVFGLKLGIDFTGGSLLEVQYSAERPNQQAIEESLVDLEIGNVLVQMVDEQNVLLRFKEVDEKTHQSILNNLTSLNNKQATSTDEANAGAVIVSGDENSPFQIEAINDDGDSTMEEMRFESVGPSIGQELKIKSLYAIIIVLVVIIAYIAWSFRKVSKPVASWKYGLSAIVALFHDVLIVTGIFAILGKFAGVELDIAFIAAILTVLGYSVNDTIVVFDRIRENLPKSNEDFGSTINTSLNQTIGRSINTSITTLLVLLSIFFFGGESIKYFVLALSIGVIAGTYSSIFIASPLLVMWEKMKK
ncbi:MAG: protein translocase subunit SecF [Candidatus Falkowbacteria bacterium]